MLLVALRTLLAKPYRPPPPPLLGGLGGWRRWGLANRGAGPGGRGKGVIKEGGGELSFS